MIDKPIVTINLVVWNGAKYIRFFLDSLINQNYFHDKLELNIWDNNSTDNTKALAEEYEDRFSDFSKFEIHRSNKNLGMWPAQEELLKFSNGEFIVASAVDIILDSNFISACIDEFSQDDKIGAIQAKILRFDLESGQPKLTNFIDTCGFKILRSRKVINVGHGREDEHEFNQRKEIFGVEGAVPVFRRSALESLKIGGEIWDKDYFWYGDDLDLVWRMNLSGWKQIFLSSAIAWHDRQTSKAFSTSFIGYLKRVHERRKIPLFKRRMDWRNVRWTIIKNDYIINILRDLPNIIWREIMVFGYTLLFEPAVFGAVPSFFKRVPKMLRKRREIMKKLKNERF